MKPKLFIASSTEAKTIADAIQCELESTASVTIWDQAFVDLSTTVLEAFEEKFKEFDFAVFVFLPEDTTKMRGGEFRTIRDNVVLELGFAMGRLGRKRCFIIVPKEEEEGKTENYDIHLPTDLNGIIHATYYPPATEDWNLPGLRTALGPACSQIREAMRKAQDKDRPSSETSTFSPPEYGILSVWEPISGGAIMNRIRLASEIWIAKTWFPEDPTIAAGLKKALTDKENTKLKMLLCDPDSDILRIRTKGAGKELAEAKAWTRNGIKIVRNAVAKEPSLEFSIGFYEIWPGCPVIRTNDHIFLGFYFLGESSPYWPWIEVRPESRLAGILIEQWHKLWEQKMETLETLEQLDDWLLR